MVPQYRLGSLGFISNGQKEASGNAGLFDMHVAINWVNKNISKKFRPGVSYPYVVIAYLLISVLRYQMPCFEAEHEAHE